MEAFLSTMILAIACGMGDFVQLFAAGQKMRYQRTMMLFGAFGLAALANCLLAAFGGVTIASWISRDALLLFYALSLGFAGVDMLVRVKGVNLLDKWVIGPFLTCFLGMFILQFGDKAQFIIAASAARTKDPVMVFLGGWIGSMVVFGIAIIANAQMAKWKWIKPVRYAIAVLLIIIALLVALRAIRGY